MLTVNPTTRSNLTDARPNPKAGRHDPLTDARDAVVIAGSGGRPDGDADEQQSGGVCLLCPGRARLAPGGNAARDLDVAARPATLIS